MGKMYPEFIFNEQINLHNLLGTFEYLYESLKVDNYSEEEELSFKQELDEELNNAREKSMVAIKIPLLNFNDIRKDLSLSDYIIYLIILETNLQGKYFDEENPYLSMLTGLSISQVEKSISKLIDLFFIHYVDKDKKFCEKRPLTQKQYDEFIKKNPDKINSYQLPGINDKRVLVVNTGVFEWVENPLKLSKQERLEARRAAKMKKNQEEVKRKNLHHALVELNCKMNIPYDDMKKCSDKKFIKENQNTAKTVNNVLSERGLTIEELIEFIEMMKRKQ